MATYHLLNEIGRGSMGVVFRALQVELKREVAVKMLQPEHAGDDRYQTQFIAEGRSLVALPHPNVVKILDVGEMNGQPFLAMELVTGTDLQTTILNRGPIPTAEVCDWMSQVASALAFMHTHRFVHRDVKPSNIILGPAEHVTLMDFGLAKCVDQSTLTDPGTVLGTIRYLAPELLCGEKSAASSDVYALALTTHELLLGRPWTGALKGQDLLARILRGPLPDLQRDPGSAPPWLVELLRQALALEPGRRLTAAQFCDRLQSPLSRPATSIGGNAAKASPLAKGVGRGSTEIPGSPPLDRHRKDTSRRASNPVLAAVFLACLVALALHRARSPVIESPPAGAAERVRLDHIEFRGWRELHARIVRPESGSAAPAMERRSLSRRKPDASPVYQLTARHGTDRVASVSASIGADLVLPDLAPDEDLILEVFRDGRSVCPPVEMRTPPLVPIFDLSVLPTERDVLVDFDVRDAPELEVRVRERDDSRLDRVLGVARGASSFHALVGGLKSSTDYELLVASRSGWAGAAPFKFRTLATSHALAAEQAIKDIALGMDFFGLARGLPPFHGRGQMDTERMSESLSNGFFVVTPDSRVIRALEAQLPHASDKAWPFWFQAGLIASRLRDPALARLCLPKIGRTRQQQVDQVLIAAAGRARLTEAFDVGRAWIATHDDGPWFEACARALSARGGPEACDAIAGSALTTQMPPVVGDLMVRCDRRSAASDFTRWLADDAARPSRASAAIEGFLELGDESGVTALARFVRDWTGSRRQREAAEALAYIPGVAAEAALWHLFVDHSTDLQLLWLMGVRGITQASPMAARYAEDPTKAPELRHAAVCVLGLLGSPDSAPLLRRLLANSSPSLAAASTWALGQLSPSRTSPERPTARLRQCIDVLPLSPYTRTGVDVYPGDSLELTTEGSWGPAPIASAPSAGGGGGGGAPVLTPVTSDRLLTGAGCRLHLCWGVGGAWQPVRRERERIFIRRQGELILSPCVASLGSIPRSAGDHLLGMARVCIER